MLSSTEPLRRAILEHFPDRPVHGQVLGRDEPAVDERRRRPRLRRPIPAGPRLRAERAGPARDRPRVRRRARSSRTTWTRRSTSSGRGSRRRSTARRRRSSRSPPRAPRACRSRRPSRTAELRPEGRRHSIARDQRAVRHHYDVSNEFFAHFLDESMTYSCAVWDRGATTLEEAQFEKLDMVCRKLDLKPGDECSTSARAGARSRVTPRREYGARTSSASRSRRRRPSSRRQRTKDAGLADKVALRGPRLPRPARRRVRRRVEHRHGRARRQPQHRRVRGEHPARSSSPAAGC